MQNSNEFLQQLAEIIKRVAAEMPSSPGVYKMISAVGEILYIGKAKNLPKRVVSYSNFAALSNRIQRMVMQIARIEYLVTRSEAEAFLLEANLIQSIKPVYNVNLKDDKSFPYIVFDKTHEFARIFKYRGKMHKGLAAFGPFASAGQVKAVLSELQKIFLLRPCSDSYFSNRSRPCLQYEIKRCSAPCVAKISPQQYAESVNQAKAFLRGRSNQVHNWLITLMQTASDNMEYEKAAQIRDRIKMFTAIQASNVFSNMKFQDIDVISVYKQNGQACIKTFFIRGSKNYGDKTYYYDNVEEIDEEDLIEQFIGQFYQHHIPPKIVLLSHKNSQTAVITEALGQLHKTKIQILTPSPQYHTLLEFAVFNTQQALTQKQKDQTKAETNLHAVRELFSIKQEIRRIEVYDNSHIAGSSPVGCMVVYGRSGFEKAQYRQFNIKQQHCDDDYKMLHEVLKRRLTKLEANNYPDLLLIDGGAGHLSTAISVLNELDLRHLNVVCISKGVERNAGREFFHLPNREPFQLPIGDETLNFLQILRDEVHNYAITCHRKRRSRELRKSALDYVPNIGSKRKNSLLKHFGSVQGVMDATVDDLANVRGISKNLANEIFNYLHTVLKS